MEIRDAILLLLENGYDLEKKSVHLYKRGRNHNVVEFAHRGLETVVDERFDDAASAVARHLELTGARA